MKRIAAAIATAMLTTPGLASADMAASRINDPTPAGVLEMHVGQGAEGAGMAAHTTNGHGWYRHHPHKVIAILVFVPGSVNMPYAYYGPAAPAYVDQDPPDGAYRELNGFYYWCTDPPGYYPYQPDCPNGWRLVAQ